MDKIAESLIRVFESPNVSNSNMEVANIVDTIDRLASAIFDLSKSINGATDVNEWKLKYKQDKDLEKGVKKFRGES